MARILKEEALKLTKIYDGERAEMIFKEILKVIAEIDPEYPNIEKEFDRFSIEIDLNPQCMKDIGMCNRSLLIKRLNEVLPVTIVRIMNLYGSSIKLFYILKKDDDV